MDLLGPPLLWAVCITGTHQTDLCNAAWPSVCCLSGFSPLSTPSIPIIPGTVPCLWELWFPMWSLHAATLHKWLYGVSICYCPILRQLWYICLVSGDHCEGNGPKVQQNRKLHMSPGSKGPVPSGVYRAVLNLQMVAHAFVGNRRWSPALLLLVPVLYFSLPP